MKRIIAFALVLAACASHPLHVEVSTKQETPKRTALGGVPGGGFIPPTKIGGSGGGGITNGAGANILVKSDGTNLVGTNATEASNVLTIGDDTIENGHAVDSTALTVNSNLTNTSSGPTGVYSLVTGTASRTGTPSGSSAIGNRSVVSTTGTGSCAGLGGEVIGGCGETNYGYFADVTGSTLGNFSFYGLAGDIYNAGNIQIIGGATLGDATHDTTIGRDLSIGRNLNVTGLTTSGSLSTGALTSTGTTTLGDATHDVSTGRDLTVGRNLSVTGTGNVVGALTENGARVFSAAGSNLTSTGATVGVVSAPTFSGLLTANGGATVDATAGFGVGGLLTVNGSVGASFNTSVTFNSGSSVLVGSAMTVLSAIRWSGVNAVTLGTSQNDYNPASLNVTNVLDITPTANINLTGIAAQPDGTWLLVENVDTAGWAITVPYESSSSLAANRIYMADQVGPFQINAGGAMLLRYNASALSGVGRWYLVAGWSDTFPKLVVNGVASFLASSITLSQPTTISNTATFTGAATFSNATNTTFDTIPYYLGTTGLGGNVLFTQYGTAGTNYVDIYGDGNNTISIGGSATPNLAPTTSTLKIDTGTPLITAGADIQPDATQAIWIGRQVLTASSGTYTPTTGAKKARLRMCGGGGGGGGASGVASSVGAAGGGSSGAYLEKWINPGSNAALTGGAYADGAGGAGGANTGANGSTGGDSTIVIQSVTYTSKGGLGGTGQTGGTALALTSEGSNITGTSSGDVSTWQNPGSPGIRLSGTVGIAGNGGSSPFGSGGPGPAVAANGNNGQGNCSGGSGALSTAATSRTGGAGAAGLIIVDEYRAWRQFMKARIERSDFWSANAANDEIEATPMRAAN